MPRMTTRTRKTVTLALAGALAALPLIGIAANHENATSDPVKARQELMKEIGAATKVLGDMAKGARVYDTAAATEAQAALMAAATRIPEAFETEATDPQSEALPAIWSDWPGFTAEARALETAAANADVSNLDAVRFSLRAIGKACGSCHESYRAD